mgnify:CR=1
MSGFYGECIAERIVVDMRVFHYLHSASWIHLLCVSHTSNFLSNMTALSHKFSTVQEANSLSYYIIIKLFFTYAKAEQYGFSGTAIRPTLMINLNSSVVKSYRSLLMGFHDPHITSLDGW